MANEKLPPRPMPNQQRPQPRPGVPRQTPGQPVQVPQWVIDQQRGMRQPINPKNYLRPDYRKAKVIDLNKMMTSWGKNQAKYKEQDEFISKKILQNLDKAESFMDVVSQEKFKKNLKTIDDIMSLGKGQISYKFKGTEIVLAEEVLDQNYIHHYKENVWTYYQEKNKQELEENNK